MEVISKKMINVKYFHGSVNQNFLTVNEQNILQMRTWIPKWKGRTRRFESRNAVSAIHRQDNNRLNKLFIDLKWKNVLLRNIFRKKSTPERYLFYCKISPKFRWTKLVLHPPHFSKEFGFMKPCCYWYKQISPEWSILKNLSIHVSLIHLHPMPKANIHLLLVCR